MIPEYNQVSQPYVLSIMASIFVFCTEANQQLFRVVLDLKEYMYNSRIHPSYITKQNFNYVKAKA